MRIMRTVAELRRDNGLSVPLKADSEYKDIKREQNVFAPLVVPQVQNL